MSEMSTFLEQARAVNSDFSQSPQYREAKTQRFLGECYLEILAVIEAAQDVSEYAKFEQRDSWFEDRLAEALDALDKKAGEI